jgi:hypothetical protein
LFLAFPMANGENASRPVISANSGLQSNFRLHRGGNMPFTYQEISQRFHLITLGILFTVAVVNAIFTLSWPPLFIAIVLLYIAFIWYGVRTQNHAVFVWLLFGFVTGLVEVVSDCDAFLVETRKVLIYPGNVPKIGVSPFYLPLAWGLVFTQLALIAESLRKRFSILMSSLITSVLAAIMISVFENLAHQAGWWHYQNTPMLLHTPYFVNLFEFLSTLLFVLAGWRITRRGTTRSAYLWAIGIGVLMGIWMCIAMRISFWLLGPCEGAVIQLPCVTPPSL